MPYKVVPVKNGFKVHKTDKNGKIIGSAMSKRPLTEEAAMAQMRALYAAENKKGIMEETQAVPEKVETTEATEEEAAEKCGGYEEMKNPGYAMMTPGPTSFEELMKAELVMESAEQAEELTDKFQMLARNIFGRDDITDKGAALEALAKEYGDLVQGAMALAKEKGNLWDRAKSALGFKASTPFAPDDAVQHIGDVDNAKRRKWAESANNAMRACEESGGENCRQSGIRTANQALKKEAKEQLFVWKEGDTYKWLAAYSNNRRDDDDPPEIISSESHKAFDAALEKGEYPMPELWLWHVPYPVGVTRWHAYDEANGFPVAAGEFNKGMEWAAEGVLKGEWGGVSHGMPKDTIQRDPDDPTIITRHQTKEVSILPVWAAANKLSFNIISKESDMSDEKGLPAHKREEFEKAFGAERVEQMEAALADKAKEADDAGIEKKETETPEPEAKSEAAPEQPEKDEEKEQLYAVLAGLVEQVNEMKEATAALTEQVATLKADKEQAEKEAEEDQPGFAQLLKALETGSVVGKEEAQIDGRSKLAKDGPAEADSEPGFFWKDIQKHNANYGRH